MSGLDRIQEHVARLSNGKVTALPEALRASCAALDDLDDFARQFGRVVDSELSRSYLQLGHGKSCKEAKAYFHKEAADLASELIGLAFPPMDLTGAPDGPLGPYNPELAKEAATAFEKDGYFVWPTRLSDQQVDRLIDSLSRTPFVERGTGVAVSGYDAATAASHPTNAVDSATDQALLEADGFQEFVTDPTLLDAVQRRLKSCPVHTTLQSWWTIGATMDEKALSQAAQLFHQDKDWIKWVKAFIYLTDVEPDTGPHVYVEGSQNDYQEKFRAKYGELPKFSARFDNEEIAEMFGADRVKPLTGKRGTIILADTSGLHKGEPVRRDHRLLMEIEWACSLYMSPFPAFDEGILSEPLKAMKQKSPRFFAKYDHAERERYMSESATRKNSGGFSKLVRSVRKRLPI